MADHLEAQSSETPGSVSRPFSLAYKDEDEILEESVQEQSGLTPIKFRKAEIEVSDPKCFHNGQVCGQAAAVDSGWDRTEANFFQIFATTVGEWDLGISWQLGFILGLADALLRDRRICPPEMRGFKPRLSREEQKQWKKFVESRRRAQRRGIL